MDYSSSIYDYKKTNSVRKEMKEGEEITVLYAAWVPITHLYKFVSENCFKRFQS